MTLKTRPTDQCMNCVILDTMPCPLLERAYRMGFEGMAECEMRAVIERVVAKEKSKLTWGPKNVRRPKIDIEGVQNEQAETN